MNHKHVGVILTMAVLLSGCSDNGTGPGASGPAGRLYVLNQGDNTMYVFDTGTMDRLDSVATRVNRPHYIEFSPDRSTFYITTLETTGHLARFATAGHAFSDSAAMPPAVQPTAIAVSADGAYGYVCNFSSPSQATRIHKYDLSTLQRVDSMQAGALTHDIKITQNGEVVLACNRNTDDLTFVYPPDDTVTFVPMSPAGSSIPGQHVYGPFGIVIDHRDSLAFVACQKALQVRVVDIAARMVIDSLDIPVDTAGKLIAGPTLMAVSPDDDVLFTTTREGNSVVVSRISTHSTLADIRFATPNPFGITMSSDGSRVYVACIGTPTGPGRIYVIDGNAHVKLDSVDVGKESFGLVWQPL